MKKGSDTSRTKIYHETEDASFSWPARQRLKWMEHFKKYRNARLTCRHFGISPNTFYLWEKRFDPNNLFSLEDKTSRPNKLRVSKHAALHLVTIKKLKEVNPKIGKVRIAKILKELGYKISFSTITRILGKIKNPSYEK